MSARGEITLQFTENLRRKMRAGSEAVERAQIAVAYSMAPQVESYMKLHAPWTDRTGNARNGLAARPFDEGGVVGIVLFHQVDYGIYLETKNEGEYAIINPTIDVMGPQVMRKYDRILDRIDI